MCGRYVLYEPAEIVERFAAEGQLEFPLKDNYNVAPGQVMPVITATEGHRAVELMKWGLVPVWAKDTKIGYKLINTRAESAFEKPMWRSLITKQRCLVPARGFYEWRKCGTVGSNTGGQTGHGSGAGRPSSEAEASGKPGQTTKQPYFIHPTDQPLFAFAGIYSFWRSPDGEPLLTYSILTTEPNDEMRFVHDRMPVILRPEDEAAWLDPDLHDRSELERFLAPYPDGTLDIYRISTDVNTPKNNDKHLIYALDDVT